MSKRQMINSAHSFFVLFFSLFLVVSCATTPPPEGAVPGRIRVVAVTESPYWASHINDYFPKALCDYANYEIATMDKSAPYTLRVTVISANSRQSGINYNSAASAASISYTTTVEAKIELLNGKGTVVWSDSGYAYDNRADRTIKRLAKMFAKRLADGGYLQPSYYSVVSGK